MLRLLIGDITVEKLANTSQVVLHVRWQGGACSDTTVALRLPIAQRVRYPAQTIDCVRELSCHLSDPQIVASLNKQGLRGSHGQPFTLAMVKWIRYRYAVPAPCLKRPEELTVRQLADQFGVSISFVHYWIKNGIIEARQVNGRGPCWLSLTDQQQHELRERIRNSGHFKNHHSNTQL